MRESSAQLLSGRLDVKVRGRSGVFYVGLKHFPTSTYRIKGEYSEIICFSSAVARRRGGPRRCERVEEHLRWEGRAGKKKQSLAVVGGVEVDSGVVSRSSAPSESLMAPSAVGTAHVHINKRTVFRSINISRRWDKSVCLCKTVQVPVLTLLAGHDGLHTVIYLHCSFADSSGS